MRQTQMRTWVWGEMLVKAPDSIQTWVPPLDEALQDLRLGTAVEVPATLNRQFKGAPSGLAIELMQMLCDQMEMRYSWVTQSYAALIPALQCHQIDVIVPITLTDRYCCELEFSDVLYPVGTRLVVRVRSRIQPTVRALRGKRVGVLRGTTQEAFALERWRWDGVIVRSYDVHRDVIHAIKVGEIDATLQDTLTTFALLSRPEGRGLAYAGPELDDPILGCSVALGVRKSDLALLEKLNQALARIRTTDAYQALSARYLV
ncbi:hypothetical protein C5615_32160 [Burkholderia cepacia]|uniref:Solute-binding protein family 3/N-terminal domain-containing protein n=1 Tax=Burkholderia cepacia TaxID=292 RepID=A0A2S8IAN2_BURCE|nr:transporter substrate-binding domain-containing protein [Burkholderia cepacia]PQP11422.1 hypothetical protein C5615_32160 [Burkholderia cepacia]HDR9511011.1 transporter substrate-binding domain-containing protein [Burkholderia cepacia]